MRCTGSMLSINFVIEIAALTTADDNPDFAQNIRELSRERDHYKNAILRRNIFGPANNVPTISARPSSSYTSMKDARISVSGKDADARDELSFELVESEVEGAALASTPGKRTAKLTVPGQQAGKYKIKLKVTDSGFPPKENFTELTVTFKDRTVKKEWVVDSIQPHSAVFLVEGKQLKFDDRVSFNEPLGDDEEVAAQ